MATRKKRAALNHAALKLIDALKFVSLTKSEFCYFQDNFLYAIDEKTIAKAPIEETLKGMSVIKQILNALSCVDGELVIKQEDELNLKIESKNTTAIVNFNASYEAELHLPENIAVLNNSLKEAIGNVIGLPNASDSEEFNGIMFKANTVWAVNQNLIIESWHGIDLPEFKLSVAHARILSKIAKDIIGFGYDIANSQVSFYFEDEYAISFPFEFVPNILSVQSFFEAETTEAFDVPEDFYKGVHFLKNFSDSIYLGEGQLRAAKNNTIYKHEGASLPFTLDGYKFLSSTFDVKALLKAEHVFDKIKFCVKEDKLLFFSNDMKTRGVMSCSYDDDIPF